MRGIGTLINCGAIISGSILGVLLKNELPKRFEKTVFSAVGLAVMFIGISGALSGLFVINDGALETRYTLLMVLSLILGSVLGELINIEKWLTNQGDMIKKRLPRRLQSNTFVDGFVTASMLFCVGAMAIVGSLEEGLTGDYSTLSAKSVLDGISALLFASTLGIGVAFSAIPLLIYQGLITLLAQGISPYLSNELILQISCVGSILIFAIGINMIFGKKINVGNLLPAIIFPIIFALIKSVWPAFPL